MDALRILALVITLGSVACAPTLHSTYTAPSSPDALECALSFAIDNGYTPSAGGTNAGFVRLEYRHIPAFGLRRLDVLTVTLSREQLHVEAASFDADGDEERASDRVRGHAAELLRRCGAAA